MDTDEQGNILEGPQDTLPKPVVKDELAYMIAAAGLASYAQTNDIRILCALVALYAIGYFGLRINSQVQETKKKAGS